MKKMLIFIIIINLGNSIIADENFDAILITDKNYIQLNGTIIFSLYITNISNEIQIISRSYFNFLSFRLRIKSDESTFIRGTMYAHVTKFIIHNDFMWDMLENRRELDGYPRRPYPEDYENYILAPGDTIDFIIYGNYLVIPEIYSLKYPNVKYVLIFDDDGYAFPVPIDTQELLIKYSLFSFSGEKILESNEITLFINNEEISN